VLSAGGLARRRTALHENGLTTAQRAQHSGSISSSFSDFISPAFALIFARRTIGGFS